jgi:hypothetical protein
MFLACAQHLFGYPRDDVWRHLRVGPRAAACW